MGVAVMGVSHLLHGIAKGNHVKKNTYYTGKPFFQKKKKIITRVIKTSKKVMHHIIIYLTYIII